MPSKKPSRQLLQLLEQSSVAIYALDDSRKIIYCNAACANWLGCDAEQLIGRRCEYHTGETMEKLDDAAAALCPPPQVFHGERTAANIVWKAADGRVEQRAATFVPLDRSDGDLTSVLVMLDDPQSVDDTSGPANEADAQALHERLQQIARKARSRYRLDRLVGESPAISRVREQVQAAIASHARVLLLGPVGSGREHIARTIHAGEDADAAGPLLPVACESLDAEMLQSTIVSFLIRCHEQRLADSPTILLLNVDQLAESAQAALLLLYRDPGFAARTIATSRQPLLTLAQHGEFNQELAYGLSTLVIELPPLAERREDIPLLAQRFVEEFNFSHGKQLAGFSPAALDRLASLPWTGNVEELATVVAEACRNVSTVWIGESDLPPRVKAVVAAGAHPRRAPESIRLNDFLLEIERELIQRAMKKSRNNKAKAARLLGVSRQRLLRRLTQLGLEAPSQPEIEFKLVDDGEVDSQQADSSSP